MENIQSSIFFNFLSLLLYNTLKQFSVLKDEMTNKIKKKNFYISVELSIVKLFGKLINAVNKSNKMEKQIIELNSSNALGISVSSIESLQKTLIN